MSDETSSENSYIFSGFDSVTNENKQRAVKGTEYKKETGGERVVRAKYIENTLDFVDEQRYKASADVSAAGLIGVNGEIEFASSKKINTLSSSLLIYAHRVAGEKHMDECRLKEECQPELITDLKAFRKVYGDCFVASYAETGEYWLMVTFYSKTLEEKQRVDAQIGGNAIVKGVTVEAGAGTNLMNAITQTQVEYEFNEKATGVSQGPPQERKLDDLIEYAQAFINMPLDRPVISNIKTKGYEEITDSSVFDKMGENRKYLTGPEGLIWRKNEVIRLKKAIDFARTAYKRYAIDLSDPDIDPVEKKADEDLKAIQSCFNQYAENPEAELSEVEITSLEKGFPDVCFEILTSQMYGGSGGGGIQRDIESVEAVQKRWKQFLPRIVSITLYSGKPGGFLNIDATNVYAVSKLEVEFENMLRVAEETIQTHNSYMTTEYQKVVHGTNNGDNNESLPISSPAKDIKEIHINSGIVVDWLKFIRKDGKTLAKGNEGGGSSHVFQIPEKSFLAGFETKTGAIMDNIKFSAVKLDRIDWKH